MSYQILLQGENTVIISCDDVDKYHEKLSKYVNVQSGFSIQKRFNDILLVANHIVSWSEMSELRKQITALLKNIR